jgi:hypothetical protein
MGYLKLTVALLGVTAFGYVKRHGFRRAWYILRTGAEQLDWEKLGARYFIAPWEKRRFEKKKAGKTPADTVGT